MSRPLIPVRIDISLGTWDPHYPPGAHPDCPCERALHHSSDMVPLGHVLNHLLHEMSVDCDCVHLEHQWILDHTPTALKAAAQRCLDLALQDHDTDVRCLTHTDNQRFLRTVTALAHTRNVDLYTSGSTRTVPTAGRIIAETTLTEHP